MLASGNGPTTAESIELLSQRAKTLTEGSASSNQVQVDQSVDPKGLLDHFVTFTDYLWMGSLVCQDLLQRHAVRLALDSTCLLHAMLSISAHHLAAQAPVNQQHYRFAGVMHYGLALQSYSASLGSETESTDIDALFSCCLILTLIAYANLSAEAIDASTSYSNGGLSLDIAGIQAISGFRTLEEAFASKHVLETSIWKPIIWKCLQNREAFDGASNIPSVPPNTLAGLKRLYYEGQQGSIASPYEAPLKSLYVMMQFDNSPDILSVTFCFNMQLDAPFLQRLREKDPKALLLLCYWHAIIVQVDQWWAHDTAKSEGLKLLDYLRDTPDPPIQALLKFPSERLGVR